MSRCYSRLTPSQTIKITRYGQLHYVMYMDYYINYYINHIHTMPCFNHKNNVVLGTCDTSGKCLSDILALLLSRYSYRVPCETG